MKNKETLFYTLDNGLTVHLKEIHTAPIISTWVWYRVGSRNETSGKTGISHWVEHMQFNGTEKFPKRVLDREISRVGGIWNAMTYLDWTTYFETLPTHAFEISLALEADRMKNSRFDPDEVNRERSVILSEREGNENQPHFLLGEAVQETAFEDHPYKNQVIGSTNDLKLITRDDLYDHYKQYYHPGNAILAIAGDFKIPQMQKKIENIYSLIPGELQEGVNIPLDPPLKSEKRVEVTGPGDTTYVQISFRAPQANHPDFFILTILDSLLSGPTSLNMFGSGGTSNKTSRLYRALVENEIAVSCFGALQATLDPYLYTLHLTVHPLHSPEEVLQAVDSELNRVLDSPITKDEIARAIKQAKALFAYSSENISNQAFWLGYSEIFANYDWFENYIAHLAKVTPEDVLNIARKYLTPDNRVVGYYLPKKDQMKA